MASLMNQPAPGFGPREAARIAERHYGVSGTARLLVAERDQNFLLRAGDGTRFLLKIANSADRPEISTFQTRLLSHLHRVDPAMPVARVVPALDGQLDCRVISPSGEEHFVRLLTWVDGEPLGQDRPPGHGLLLQLGEMLARLDSAMGTFEGPVPDQSLAWDMMRADALEHLTAHVPDGPVRAQVEDLLIDFRDRLLPGLKRRRAQPIYNDLNPSNILVNPDKPLELAGIIDFGDVVEAPTLVDLAVAGAYQMGWHGDVLGLSPTLVSGYHGHTPLGREDAGLLYDLMLMRHVLTVVITHWRASRHPENREYILRNAPRALSVLGMARDADPETQRARLREVCP